MSVNDAVKIADITVDPRNMELAKSICESDGYTLTELVSIVIALGFDVLRDAEGLDIVGPLMVQEVNSHLDARRQY